ncbi:LysE family translocator [Herbaspirillum sp. WKF16]|jgi:threonine/homoserine/homoserine lactone efflux protein|uniref:LysE family translocator n=1 Tax=Herbaspirillum sp. WKF16 TaxID=3028312 RepID=UPI0023A94E91|nr:LysE family translocator [Herbaspirillum sp. WKF16]WDZ95413.1 LysE family translocator [Herbaspirillum sp. WKF16]
MIAAHDLLIFALASLVMVLTPGPNMVYCVSRSICQGRMAGIISLCGVAVGFLVHMAAAAFGLTALFLAIPMAYDIVKFAGAAYLLWLAWNAVRPGGSSPFQTRELPPDSPATLFRMGFLTNVLNPKVAVFYMSLFPQFIHPEHGSVLMQSVALGLVQIAISFSVNSMIVFSAAGISGFFARNQGWLRAQRYIMGSMLGALAVRLALDERK